MIVIGTEAPLIVPDTPGTIAITYPVGGESWFTGTTYYLTADAVDADGVASVDWYLDNVYIGTSIFVSGTKWQCGWTADRVGVGMSLVADLVDVHGNETFSTPVLITVNTPG